jgi:hypothetical protein
MAMIEFGTIDTNIWQASQIIPKIESFVNTDAPQIIHIVESGWDHPRMYSVIVEDGELGYPDLKFLTAEQIKTNYNINLKPTTHE